MDCRPAACRPARTRALVRRAYLRPSLSSPLRACLLACEVLASLSGCASGGGHGGTVDRTLAAVGLKDAQAVVFHHATLALHAATDQSGWQLHATVVGAPVDQATQDLRSDVKGVTKHLYAVTQAGTRWKARVVLDV